MDGKINGLLNSLEIREKMSMGFSEGLKNPKKKAYYKGMHDAFLEIRKLINDNF